MTVERIGTKELIARSLADLAAQGKSIKAITVKEIADNCGISKRTFYYHFTDKYDVIAWSYEQFFRPMFLDCMARGEYFETQLRTVRHVAENGAYYMNLFKNTDGFDAVPNTIAASTIGAYEEYLVQTYGSEVLTDDTRFSMRFSCVACIEAIVSWLFGGMVQSPEELAQRLIDNMPANLRPLLIPEHRPDAVKAEAQAAAAERSASTLLPAQ